ncbi:Gfo/Idh/MocA family oxidoreductase [Frankia sp. AvcI1]|uniref:Gfo/Idh/MocA family oxidoreductase n=1 Tax=Frankia sp. AvcI1 TaxID=573496 RepID=UPI002117F7D8|nr:Gfo/Idh/MocA family oxidoreductase [Frankia sp. AvcI1]
MAAAGVGRRRVLIIGSGRRIRKNFLPAFAQRRDQFELVGLWSRTREHAERAAAPWGVPVVGSPAEVLDAVDTVVVSVSTTAVRAVLRDLAERAPQLSVVLDTPVFGQAAHLPAMATLRSFARVVVAEDYMNYPQWTLARRAVADGLIGEVRSVELAHSGYRYHGLALIRSLADFDHVTVATRRRAGADVRFDFRLRRGLRGRITEPYDQARGTTTITGEKGVITDSARVGAVGAGAGHGPVHVLRPRGDARPDGYLLDGPDLLGGLELDLPALPALLDAEVPDRSLFNALKTCGLLEVLAAVTGEAFHSRYTYREALYDHLTTAVLRTSPLVVDPVAGAGGNIVGGLDGVFTGLARARGALTRAGARGKGTPTGGPA